MNEGAAYRWCGWQEATERHTGPSRSRCQDTTYGTNGERVTPRVCVCVCPQSRLRTHALPKPPPVAIGPQVAGLPPHSPRVEACAVDMATAIQRLAVDEQDLVFGTMAACGRQEVNLHPAHKFLVKVEHQ